MNQQNDKIPDPLNPLDQATARRLRQLGTMPMDVRRVKMAVEAQIITAVGRKRSVWIGPMRLAASVLLVVGVIAILLTVWSDKPAMASAESLVNLREHILAAHHPMTPANSVEQAASQLHQQWPDAPKWPVVPDEYVIGACRMSLGDKPLACLCMMVDGQRVMLMVAKASDVTMPDVATVKVGTLDCCQQSARGINVLMTQTTDRWIALVGPVSPERLTELAKSMDLR